MATMKSSVLLFMLAFLGISSSVVPAAQAAGESDFFYLNIVWPGANCSMQLWYCCCTPTTGKPAKDFFVESMETYDSYTGNVVTNCTSKCSFKVNQLRDFITDMNLYWSDVSCPENNGVEKWKSTFCKYGTCSSLTQAEYFKRALAIYKKLDLLNYLAGKGIVPSMKTRYNLEDIESALRAKLGFSFVIECNIREPPGLRLFDGTIDGVYLLQNQGYFGSQIMRIKICVSADGKNIITCPINKETNCGSIVKFPPFEYYMLDGCQRMQADDQQSLLKMPFEKNHTINV